MPKRVMKKSRFLQVTIPDYLPGGDAPEVARGWDVAVRVHIRNAGPVMVFLSDTLTDLTAPEGPSGAICRLPPGERDVLYLAPEQKLYGLGAGPGGFVSMSLSEAVIENGYEN
jgi:hypothetical protein